jgi:phenylalanyl-tRNA synthetase beta chain
VDPEGTLYALDRAVLLLKEIASGSPLGGVADRYARRRKSAALWVRHQRVKALLGIDLASREVEKITRALGLKIQRRSKTGLQVIPPSYRPDLAREADVIEELARVYGYDKIPTTLPLVRARGGMADAHLRWERAMRSFLAGEGLTEMIHLPFTSREMNRRFPGLWHGPRLPVEVLNPLTQENAEMRLSLIPGLVESLRAQVSQKSKGFYGFDLGKVFSLGSTGAPEERQCLAGTIFGYRERRGLRVKEQSPSAFLDIKGLVEGIVELVGVARQVEWTGGSLPPILHPGKAASLEIAGSRVGCLGELHPDLCEELRLPCFFIFEVDFEKLVQYAPREFKVRSLRRFPSVERDLAVVLDDGFPAQRLVNWIKEQFNHSLIEEVQVFDQYKGAPVPQGKKSLAYTISYRAEDRTLTDTEVNALHGELVSRIGQVFGAQLRE